MTPDVPSAASPYPALPPPVAVPLTVCPEHPCPYLPARTAQSRAFAADAVAPEIYHQFMNAGFRRSGQIFYQPICNGCRACMQIRVIVDRFEPDKSQRRCRRRNADLVGSTGFPAATDEKYALYCRYLAARHQGPMADDREGFDSFLYQSPVETIEITHRDRAGRLLAVGICDVSELSLSTVYFYYDPAEAGRGLGNFGALVEIELARQLRIPYYYMGYWIRGCRAMEYKTVFRPAQVLHPDGVWRDAV